VNVVANDPQFEITSHPEFMLTTKDNPCNPFTDFPAWLAWDTAHGYHTTEWLGRMAVTSNDLTPGDLQFAINSAIDEIVEMNVTGMHIKVSADSYADVNQQAA
jgi:hypothetical protein